MNKILNYSEISDEIEDYILYRENIDNKDNLEQTGGSNNLTYINYIDKYLEFMRNFINEIYSISSEKRILKNDLTFFTKQDISDLICSVFASNGNIIEKTNESFEVLQNTKDLAGNIKYKYLIKPTYLSLYSEISLDLEYKKKEFKSYYNFLERLLKKSNENENLNNIIPKLLNQEDESIKISYRFTDLLDAIIINLLSVTIDFGSHKPDNKHTIMPPTIDLEDTKDREIDKLINKIINWTNLLKNDEILELIEKKIKGNTSANYLDISENILNIINEKKIDEIMLTEFQYALKKIMIDISSKCTDDFNNKKSKDDQNKLDDNVNNVLKSVINGIKKYNQKIYNQKKDNISQLIYIKGGLAFKINNLNEDPNDKDIFNQILKSKDTISDIDTSILEIDDDDIIKMNDDVYTAIKDELNEKINEDIESIKNNILDDIFNGNKNYYSELKNKVIVNDNTVEIPTMRDSDKFSYLSVHPISNSLNPVIIYENKDDNPIKDEGFSLMRLYNKYKFSPTIKQENEDDIKLNTNYKFFFEIFDLSIASKKSNIKFLTKNNKDTDLIQYKNIKNIPIMSNLFFITDFNAMVIESIITKKFDPKELKRLKRCLIVIEKFVNKDLIEQKKHIYKNNQKNVYTAISFDNYDFKKLDNNTTTIYEQLLFTLNTMNNKFVSDSDNLTKINMIEDKIIKYFEE